MMHFGGTEALLKAFINDCNLEIENEYFNNSILEFNTKTLKFKYVNYKSLYNSLFSNYGKYLNEIKKFKYLNLEKRTWLTDTKNDNSNTLFRFDGLNDLNNIITSEYHHCINNDYYYGESNNYISIDNSKIASKEKIEEVLSIVAKQKGYKKGIKINSKVGLTWIIPTNDFKYDKNFDCLMADDIVIYINGAWSEIINPKFYSIDGFPLYDDTITYIFDNYVFYDKNKADIYCKHYFNNIPQEFSEDSINWTALDNITDWTKDYTFRNIKTEEEKKFNRKVYLHWILSQGCSGIGCIKNRHQIFNCPFYLDILNTEMECEKNTKLFLDKYNEEINSIKSIFNNIKSNSINFSDINTFIDLLDKLD